MNIVAVLGSPRQDGNSALLAERILQTAEQRGAHATRFQLNDLDYKGCQACYACKQGSEVCVVQDDLTMVLDAVAVADVVLMASPVYCSDISAQLKGFVDRLFAFLVPGYIAKARKSRFPENKKLIFILAQGHRDPGFFADIVPRYLPLLQWFGFDPAWPLQAVDVYFEGDVAKREDLLKEADRIIDEILPAPGGKEMKRILVVDDSPFFTSALKDMLSGDGFDVTTAASGEEAAKLLDSSPDASDSAKNPFDLLITDLVMPGMSGFELSEFVREKNQTSKFMPVIMLTEKEITKEEARKYGCSAYIPKNNLDKVVSMTRILLTV